MLGLQQASFAGGPGKRSDPLLMLRVPLIRVIPSYTIYTITYTVIFAFPSTHTIALKKQTKNSRMHSRQSN
jgi:hypothetical protein